MNVVICDDDKLFIKDILNIIEPVIKKEFPFAKFYCFNNGSYLFQWYIQENSTIDILYIDVEMPGYNGLEVIKKLRDQGCSCLAIFISLYQTYVFDTLDFDITHYLLKPFNSNKVISVTKRALFKYKIKHNVLTLVSNDQHIVVSISEIICIESNLGKLIYHTTNGDFIVNEKISHVEKVLIPYNFLRSHKSFIINMEKVLYYQHYRFYLLNGFTAEISRKRRSYIISTFNEFIEKKEFNEK